MMSLILFFFSLPIILILYFQTQKPKNGNKLIPPGQPGLPLIGNLHQIDGQFQYKYFQRLSKQYGHVMFLNLGIRHLIVISTAEAVKEITKSNDAIFSSRPSFVAAKRLSYNHLDIGFSSYNDTWREMRKISNLHLFSSKQVQSFHPIFRDEVSKMMEKIARDASSSTVVNFTDTTMSLLTNIFSRIAFGKIYGKDRFMDLLHETQPILGGFFMEDYFPWLRWIDRLSGMTAKLDKNFHNLDLFYQELIEEHMNPNRPKSMDGDFIDIMLRIKENGSSSFAPTINHIKGVLMDLVTGGSDTTAIALEWTMTALMEKPLVMKKLQEEIRRFGGKKDMINKQDIEKLSYLRAVVKEGLRMYPPAPLLVPRETTNKCSVNGYEIEGGSMVFINAWAIGRDPATWENADEFMPERFLEGGQNPELITFGFGRRGCPGMGMAIAELELALANLVYKFNWEFPKEEDIDLECKPRATLLRKKNALRLIAKVVM
ncbi:cytochrome P450 71A1-like [Salvia splendens]|uniref:cytochrome P450 71A1-like n=1 Tax=Salvia splendens TaxID=180675 RepID=UPI001C28011A|nr:cytochrome P450 71A1-like [Salvia splendens]